PARRRLAGAARRLGRTRGQGGPEAGDLRRARRRSGFDRVLLAVRAGLRVVLALSGAGCARRRRAGGGGGRGHAGRVCVGAAGAVGAERFVAQSIAFLYDPVGQIVKDEDAAAYQNPAPEFRDALAALLELERAVGDAGGTVLRYGYFYGPGSAYASDGAIA